MKPKTEDQLSKRDAKIFFDTIMGNSIKNDLLNNAAKEHEKFTLDGESVKKK